MIVAETEHNREESPAAVCIRNVVCGAIFIIFLVNFFIAFRVGGSFGFFLIPAFIVFCLCLGHFQGNGEGQEAATDQNHDIEAYQPNYNGPGTTNEVGNYGQQFNTTMNQGGVYTQQFSSSPIATASVSNEIPFADPVVPATSTDIYVPGGDLQIDLDPMVKRF